MPRPTTKEALINLSNHNFEALLKLYVVIAFLLLLVIMIGQ